MNGSTINSKHLSRPMDIAWIFSDQLQEGEVQLLFVQDGKNYVKSVGLKESFEQLINEQPDLAANVVMVLIHPGSPSERRTIYHPHGENHQAFVNFFYEELLPDVKGKMEAIDLTIAKLGSISDSLGAVANLYLAMKKPDLWSHILLQSAAFEPFMLEDAHEHIQNVNWNIYQVVGEQEKEFTSPISGKTLFIYENNQKFRDLFKEKGISLAYYEEDESHRWVFWKKDLPRALRFFIEN
jgi:enterochelin esterase-like enzyme